MKKLCVFLFLTSTIIAKAQKNLKLGEPAPNINISSWIANVPENKELTNRFIVLEFWTTWCGPCIGAVPHVNELVKEFGKDILFVSLTNESAARVERSLKRTPFLSAVATDESGHTNQEYGDGKRDYTALPMAVLIDKGNIIKWIGNPSNLTSEILRSLIDGTIVQKNYFADYRDFKDEVDDANLNSFIEEIKLLKKSTLEYFFELKAVKKNDDNTTISGTLLYANSNVDLKTFLSDQLAIPRDFVSVPAFYENDDFKILYKNKNPTINLNADLLNDVTHKLGLEKQVVSSMVDGYKLTLNDSTKLEKTLDTNTSTRSDIYDTSRPDVQGIAYKNIALKNFLLDLSKTTEAFFFTDATLEGNYDFTIETKTIEDIKRSLAFYGFELVPSKIAVEKVIYTKI